MKWKTLLRYSLYITSVIVLVILLENYGWWGLLIWLAALTIYRAWSMRKVIVSSMKYIESMIWGKPLDKDMWDKGELGNTKVEVYFKGKRLGGKHDSKQ